ncbi:TetR/AcrR family transcriptional regulator [Amycolatopsis minnesotensis]|uniref:TetR/AcrR family transcriptional regulator n=1 Tax=Amycolatopsis minnesotensis TaxID=337894 RepID=A0ABN2SZ52_9PSEU
MRKDAMVYSQRAVDHRTLSRRRGKELHDAILDAAYAELTEHGYGAFSLDRVAERARTGKTSVYKRWPTRPEIVIAAVLRELPDRMDVPDTGDLREDLIEVLRYFASRLASPIGKVMPGLLAESIRDFELRDAFREHIFAARPLPVDEVLRRAVERGQARPSAVHPRVVMVGPALLREHFFLNGAPIAEDVLADIVDTAVLPLVLI